MESTGQGQGSNRARHRDLEEHWQERACLLCLLKQVQKTGRISLGGVAAGRVSTSLGGMEVHGKRGSGGKAAGGAECVPHRCSDCMHYPEGTWESWGIIGK